MRVLILSANTGGGHNSTAQALAHALARHGAEYEIADTLAFISVRLSDLVSRGHTYVYRRLPRLFGIGYRFEERHTPHFIYEQCARGAESLYRKLTAGGFDAVLCVHVFSAMMLTEVRARYSHRIPAYFIATDYTCSPGVSETDLEKYCIPHRMLLGDFVRHGIPADKLIATGIPVRACFYKQLDKTAAKRALGIDPAYRVVLLGCGSMGCGHPEQNALTLLRHLPRDTVLVVLCGTNKRAHERLLPHTSKRFRPIPYTGAIATYLSAADLYLTKAGGLTTAEAIAKQLPMILVHTVPGVETRNYDFLLSRGVAKGARNWRQAATLAKKALRDPLTLQARIDAMRDFSNTDAAEQVCRLLLSEPSS